jgi:hypothetical protein
MKKGKFVQAKSKWNPYLNRAMMTQSGFPDYIIIKEIMVGDSGICSFEVRFVECKVNGYLSKEEKNKVGWIKSMLHIPVIVTKRGEKRGKIEYVSQ